MFRLCVVISLIFCLSSCTHGYSSQPIITVLKNKAITPSVPQIKEYRQLKGKLIRLDTNLPDDHLMVFFPQHTDMIVTLGSQGNCSLIDQLHIEEQFPLQHLTRVQCRELLTSAPNYGTYHWRLQKLIS
jgi:hypothetical protein